MSTGLNTFRRELSGGQAWNGHGRNKEERFCYVCQNLVEPEVNVVTHCPLYDDPRDLF